MAQVALLWLSIRARCRMWVPCDHMSHEPADCVAGCKMGVLIMVCRVSNISKGGKYLPSLAPPPKKKQQPGLLLNMHMGKVVEWVEQSRSGVMQSL